MTPHPARGPAIATILLTLLGWSSIPLFLRHLTSMIDAWTANGWRYAISALIWLPVILLGLSRRNLPQGLWKAALIPSIFNALGQVCFGLAPYYIEPGLMTFSLRLQIVFLTLGAAFLFPSERVLLRRPLFLLGIVIVFVGTMATVALRPGGFVLPTSDSLGDVIGVDHTKLLTGVAISVASGLFYAAYALCVRKYMHGIPALTAFAAVSQYTAIMLVVLMFALAPGQGQAALDLSASQFGMLVASAVVGIGIGHTFYFFSIARLGLAVSSGVVQLQPFVVSIASLFIFGERLTTWQWLTGSAAVCGAGLMLFAQHRASRATK